VYYTKKEAIDLANKKKYPNDISDEAKQKLFNNAVKSYQKTQYPVTKKIGFNLVGLGWKTKWSNTDYRFEWAPLVSFVFFKLQIAIMFIAPEQDHYWEAWLFYERNIDKSKSKDEKIQICMNEYPLNYIQYKNGKETKINYYKLILKEKYLKYIKD
jgi:hypothetical protein